MPELLDADKILRKNIPAAFVLNKDRNAIVPANFEDKMQAFLNVGPDMVTDVIRIHAILELLDGLSFGKYLVKVPIAVFIN